MTSPHDSSSMALSELEEILKEIGLNEKESKIYLELLHLGEGFPGHIANKTGINRTAVYVTLKHLAGKGLAEMKTKWGQQCFVAKSCDVFLNTQKSKFEERIKKIERAKIQLNKITPKKEKSDTFSFIEGKITSFCQDVIQPISPLAGIFIKEKKQIRLIGISTSKTKKHIIDLVGPNYRNLKTPSSNAENLLGKSVSEGKTQRSLHLEDFTYPTITKKAARSIQKISRIKEAIAVPITHKGKCIGSILLTFTKEIEITSIKKRLKEISEISGFYLNSIIEDIRIYENISDINDAIADKKSLTIVKNKIEKIKSIISKE